MHACDIHLWSWSSHGGPHDLQLRPVHALCRPLPVALGMDWETSDQGRTGGLAFPRGRKTRLPFWLSLLPQILSRRNQLLVMSAFQATCEEVPGVEGKPLDTPARLRPTVSLELDYLVPVKPCCTAAAANSLTAVGDSEPEPLARLSSSLLPAPEAVRENKCLLFQAAKFGKW